MHGLAKHVTDLEHDEVRRHARDVLRPAIPPFAEYVTYRKDAEEEHKDMFLCFFVVVFCLVFFFSGLRIVLILFLVG